MFHTCILFVSFSFIRLPLKRVTAQSLSLSAGSCLFVGVFSFAVSPGTWLGGAWVPGGLRPGCVVSFFPRATAKSSF